MNFPQTFVFTSSVGITMESIIGLLLFYHFVGGKIHNQLDKIHYSSLHAIVFSNLLLFCISCSRPPWFDLPPPPYCSESESPSQTDLPPYRSRTGSSVSTGTPMAGNSLHIDHSRTRCISNNVDHHETLLGTRAEQNDSLINSAAEREMLQVF